MNLSAAIHGRKYGLLCLILASTMILAACSSVEHIRLYRDARSDFSEAAKNDNLTTYASLFPDLNKLTVAEKDKPLVDYNTALQSYERWAAVHAEFMALNNKAEMELNQDKLLGSSKAMQVLAEARENLYGQILIAKGEKVSAPALTNAVKSAEEVLKDKDLSAQLFPRDGYLLRSLKPVTRYEIAYVNTLRAVRGLGAKLETVSPLSQEMAEAEKELAENVPSASCPDNVKLYATASRFIMLHTARFLLQDLAKQVLPFDPNGNEVKDNPGITEVDKRIKAFREEAVSEESPAKDFLIAIGLVTDDAKNLVTDDEQKKEEKKKAIYEALTRNGLGIVVKPSN